MEHMQKKLLVMELLMKSNYRYLFDIVIDYVLRNAAEDQTLGITLHSAKGPTYRTTQQDHYLTDLDYADDITLLSSSFEDAQKSGGGGPTGWTENQHR
jgi:hypothetical protein